MADHDDVAGADERQFSRRTLLLAAAQAIGFSLIGWRLFELQVLERGHYAPLAEENRINLQILAPRRGRILDIAGRPLADNEEMFRATITPALVKNIRDVLTRVQRILPLTDVDIEEIIRRTRKQSRNVPTVVATDLDFDHIAKLNLFAPSLPGVGTEIAWRRRYHGGASIGHVVGFVGNVDRFGVDDDAVLRLPDMRVGKYGAEAAFETDLRGSGGTRKVEVDARGRVVRNIETVEPVHGRDITLSVDTDLQQAIWKRLENEHSAAVVVLDVQTGEIVALNSVPGFDPASISGGISETDWQKLTTADDKPLLNRAVSGQYAPGSTFKIVTALAALGAGVVTPDEHLVCKGHYEFADQTYPCWKSSGHGDLTMHDAIRCSCDVFFFEMARRVGIKKIAEAARRLGLGAVYDFGLTDEKAGVVPDPDWKRGNLNAAWLGVETLLTGIGQGYVLTTPLQLALMTARIAGGRGVVPSIEKRNAQPPKQDFAALSFNAAHLEVVRDGMIAAVNDDGGTGEKAKLGEGRPMVAGKTGTSQIGLLTSETVEDSLERSKRDHALFVAYMPAKAPRYAIATVIEHGGDGGTMAAPLARDVLNLVLDRDTRARNGKDAPDDGATSPQNASETAG